jgi:hypothetical protein
VLGEDAVQVPLDIVLRANFSLRFVQAYSVSILRITGSKGIGTMPILELRIS